MNRVCVHMSLAPMYTKAYTRVTQCVLYVVRVNRLSDWWMMYVANTYVVIVSVK